MHYVIDASDCSQLAMCGCGWRHIIPHGSHLDALKALAQHEARAHKGARTARAAAAKYAKRHADAEKNNLGLFCLPMGQ